MGLKKENSTAELNYSVKYVVWICALFSALILGRAVSDIAFYAFAAISLVIFVLSNVKHCVSFTMFLLPFSTFLKPSVDSMSFFTVLFFLVVVKMVLANNKINLAVISCVLVLFVYCFIFSGTGQLATTVTMACGLLMVYYVGQDEYHIGTAVVAYSVGICFSSGLALLKSWFPLVSAFVRETSLRLESGTYADRFSGLQGNPNYYTLDIIVVLSAIVVLMYTKRSNVLHIVCLVALSVFGLMSVSKAFLFAWALLMAFWLLLSVRQGTVKIIRFVIIAVIGVYLIYYFAGDYLDTYLQRFLEDESSSLRGITTGRTYIWGRYIEAIVTDAKIFFFGNGLNTILSEVGKGTHNTFIEMVFDLGFVGSIILIVALKVCAGKIMTRGVIFVPICILAFRMMAAGILTYDNLWLYFMLIVMLAKECKEVKKDDGEGEVIEKA